MARFASVLMAVAIAGCANLRAASSGQIGCPESDIEISDEETGAGWKTWRAECAGRVYYCSYHATGEKSGQYSCRADATVDESAENSAGVVTEQGSGRKARETPEPHPRSEPPTEAVGFTLTDSVESAERACVDAGHEWSPAKDASVCSGTPSSVGAEAKARLAFCDDQLCDLTVFVTFEGEADGADDQLKAIVDAMHESMDIRRKAILVERPTAALKVWCAAPLAVGGR